MTGRKPSPVERHPLSNRTTPGHQRAVHEDLNAPALDVLANLPRHGDLKPQPSGALLCVRHERPGRCVAEQRYELAPPHVGPPPPESVCRTLSLPQDGRRVLWTDLNAHRPMVSGSSIAN